VGQFCVAIYPANGSILDYQNQFPVRPTIFPFLQDRSGGCNSCQIDYFYPDGKRVRKSFKKRKDAEAEPGKRVSLIAEGRYLDEDEIANLLSSCPNVYTKDIIETIIHTGMRRQEVLGLKWSHIRNGFIYLTKTKTDESRQIPANNDLAELFKSIRKRNELRSEHVFCDKHGEPFKETEDPSMQP
jgi:integrase